MGNNVFDKDNNGVLTPAKMIRPPSVVDIYALEAQRPVLDVQIKDNGGKKPTREIELPPSLSGMAPYLDLTKNIGELVANLQKKGVVNQNGDSVNIAPRQWDTDILAMFYPYLKSDKRTLDFPYQFYFDAGTVALAGTSVYTTFANGMFGGFLTANNLRWNAWNMSNTADKARIAGMDLYAMRVIPAFNVFNITQNRVDSDWVDKVLYPWFMNTFGFRIFNDASASDPVINVTAFANVWNRFNDGFTRVPDVHFDTNDNNGHLEVGALSAVGAGGLLWPGIAGDSFQVQGNFLLEGRWVDARPAAEGILDWIRRNPQ